MSQAGSFKPASLPPGAVVETLTGNTGGPVGPDGSDNINVVGDGTTVTVVGNPGTNTLTISAIGEASSFPTDSGTATPSAGILNIITNVAAQHAGATVLFSGSGDTVLFNVTDASFNTILGEGSGNATISGDDNVIFGSFSGFTLTNGSENVVVGGGSFPFVTTGDFNVVIGNTSAENYVGNESSNILIGHNVDGIVGDANTLRIGSGSGTGAGELNRVFINGINGINVGSVATVVTESGNQLGTAVITAGTGITVTPGSNTITIATSGLSSLAYTNVNTSPYVVLTTDDYLSVDSSGGAITVQLANAATSGKTFIIKDRTGSAATHNITVTTVGGAVNIDGATSFVMNTAFQAISVIGNGSSYEIY